MLSDVDKAGVARLHAVFLQRVQLSSSADELRRYLTRVVKIWEGILVNNTFAIDRFKWKAKHTLESPNLWRITAQLAITPSISVRVCGVTGAIKSSQLFRNVDSFMTSGLCAFIQEMTLRAFCSCTRGHSIWRKYAARRLSMKCKLTKLRAIGGSQSKAMKTCSYRTPICVALSHQEDLAAHPLCILALSSAKSRWLRSRPACSTAPPAR